jgi:sugar phosphate isomerase/epimerase
MDRVLIATTKSDLPLFREHAEKHGLGLELQAFADPKTLSNNWPKTLQWHKDMLTGFSGEVGLHGAFYDLTSASLDPAILEITRLRYRQNLRIASELGALYVLFHLNYLGFCKIPNYRPGWHDRQVTFWSEFAAEAEEAGVPVLIENSWEDEPALIADILAEVNSPYLMACLDIAHATLYSSYSVETWITALEPYLFCSHLNNHNGEYDVHWPLNRGVVAYSDVISSLRNTSFPPYLCLEMPRWSFMEPSLSYLETSRKIEADAIAA